MGREQNSAEKHLLVLRTAILGKSRLSFYPAQQAAIESRIVRI